MPAKKYELGDTELEVLNHVLELGEASVHDVLDRINKYRPLAYTTVMTILKKLAKKGYLSYEQDGKAYIYRPAQSKTAVRKGLLRRFVDTAFAGSPMDLVQTLVREEQLSSEDLEELDRLIARIKAKEAGNDA